MRGTCCHLQGFEREASGRERPAISPMKRICFHCLECPRGLDVARGPGLGEEVNVIILDAYVQVICSKRIGEVGVGGT